MFWEYTVISLHGMSTNIAWTVGSTSIRYRSDTSVSDRCLIDVDPNTTAITETIQYIMAIPATIAVPISSTQGRMAAARSSTSAPIAGSSGGSDSNVAMSSVVASAPIAGSSGGSDSDMAMASVV